jgi:hypothetical protein
VTAREVSSPEMTAEMLRVHRAGEALHRDGASPAGALDLLAAIVEDRTWERLADVKGVLFAGRFRAFVEARPPFGLGYDPDQLREVIKLRHPHESVERVAVRMDEMRAAVETELLAGICKAPDRGAGRPNARDTRINPSRESDGVERVVARLKRDDPELAEQVVRGEITPNAAARKKGWRRARIVVSTPERTAKSLQKHMPPEDFAQFAAEIRKLTAGGSE